MNLPKQPAMRNTVHGHGAKGMYFYKHEDVDGLGIHIEIRRESRKHPEVIRFYYDYLPEQFFPDYRTLWDAVAALSDEQHAAEKLKYPLLRSCVPVGERDYGNKCRLCPWPDGRKPGVVIVHLAGNWLPSDDRYTELCGDHQHLAQDPRALWDALDAEVVARRAVAAAKGLLR